MKILLIGGTGTISSAITRQLAAAGHNLWLLNRGTRKQEVPAGVHQIVADINDASASAQLRQQIEEVLGGALFDAVCEFIGFLPVNFHRKHVNISHIFLF